MVSISPTLYFFSGAKNGYFVPEIQDGDDLDICGRITLIFCWVMDSNGVWKQEDK